VESEKLEGRLGMIVSFTNRFIFIKTRKTAGTSTEIVLSSWCEAPDFCSRISKNDEPLRAQYGGLAPIARYNGRRINNHMPASAIAELVPDFWPEAFKFAVERHPYEKIVSRAYWNIGKRGGDPAKEFEAELETVLEPASFDDEQNYMIDGKIAVDEIIMFEDLWTRLEALGRSLGKSLPRPLPRAKGHHRINRLPAREILTNDQKAQIRQKAARQFDLFGFAE
jgi:hypothetical protein